MSAEKSSDGTEQELPPLDITDEEDAAANDCLEGEWRGSVILAKILHRHRSCRERQLRAALSEVARLTSLLEASDGTR